LLKADHGRLARLIDDNFEVSADLQSTWQIRMVETARQCVPGNFAGSGAIINLPRRGHV
jgi:hypothetical protein